MVKFISSAKGSGSGGSGGSSITVHFNPPGGTYGGTTVSVNISVTGATRLRWKLGSSGTYTTVNAASTVVSVGLTSTGKTLFADALSATGAVLASGNAFYDAPGGGQ